MRLLKSVVGAFAAAAVLLPGPVLATTREIADVQTAPLTVRRSVINELSGGLFRDPYDEFQRRPFNLSFVNIERYPNLSPWPGQEGEQYRYVNALIGNTGNTNVRNGSDVLQGTYIRQSGESLSWGASFAYLSDDSGNADSVAGSTFTDGEELAGVDFRAAVGYRVSERMVLGGGISVLEQGDDVTDSSFQPGVGGFYSLQELDQSGIEADVGIRRFTSGAASWEAQLGVGVGDIELSDFSEDLDDTGAVISRFVVTDYQISNSYVQLSGGYNRLYNDYQGELQLLAGYRTSERELDNTDLSFTDVAGIITPNLALVGQDPVGESELFVSAGTVFLRGQSQFFARARLSLSEVDGSTQVDSLGTLVTESIDDSLSRLDLTVGVRQPLWNEKLRFIAGASAAWIDEDVATVIDSSASGSSFSQTTTNYTVGFEAVLNNVAFDLAWLFGEGSLPGGSTTTSRQTIDLDRVVISATVGW